MVEIVRGRQDTNRRTTYDVMGAISVKVVKARDEPEVPEERPARDTIRQLVLKPEILTTSRTSDGTGLET